MAASSTIFEAVFFLKERNRLCKVLSELKHTFCKNRASSDYAG